MQSTCPLHLRCSQELQTTALGRTGLEPIRIEACQHGSMSAWVRTRVMGKQPYERRLERTPIAPCAQLVGWYDHALCKIGYESLVRTNPFPNLQWAMKRAYRTSQTRSQRQHTTFVTDRMHAAFTVPLTAPNYLARLRRETTIDVVAHTEIKSRHRKSKLQRQQWQRQWQWQSHDCAFNRRMKLTPCD